MKKKQLSKVLTPSVNTDSLRTAGELPSVETVNALASKATGQPIKTGDNKTAKKTTRHEAKKGTVSQILMIDKDLLKQLKHIATDNEKTLSQVANEAFIKYINSLKH